MDGVINMDLNTVDKQVATINALDTVHRFIAEHSADVNEDKKAELLICLDDIENKIKLAILQERKLDEIINSYTEQIENQKKLIEKQTQMIAGDEPIQDEEKLSKEFGVIIDGI